MPTTSPDTNRRPTWHRTLLLGLLLSLGVAAASAANATPARYTPITAESNDDEQLSIFKQFIESLPDDPQQNS